MQVTNKQLRRRWMNLKQRQRESITKEKQHRIATGGGPSTPDIVIDADIAEIAPALIVGVDEAIDSDTIPELDVSTPNSAIVSLSQSLPSTSTAIHVIHSQLIPSESVVTVYEPPRPILTPSPPPSVLTPPPHPPSQLTPPPPHPPSQLTPPPPHPPSQLTPPPPHPPSQLTPPPPRPTSQLTPPPPRPTSQLTPPPPRPTSQLTPPPPRPTSQLTPPPPRPTSQLTPPPPRPTSQLTPPPPRPTSQLTPPPPRPPSRSTPPTQSSRLNSRTTAPQLLSQKQNIIEKEYSDRHRRAEEQHKVEMEILRHRAREAKAKADLAEYILQEKRSANVSNTNNDEE